MSPTEALTQIRALCDEHGPGPGWIPTDDVRAVLDAVSVDATPACAAGEALRPYLGRLHDADEAVSRTSIYMPPERIIDVLDEQHKVARLALTKALDLLGVRPVSGRTP